MKKKRKIDKNTAYKIAALLVVGLFALVAFSSNLMAQSWGTDITDDLSKRIIIDNDNNANDEVFAVWTDGEGGSELFRVQEDGYVGIGTTSPGGFLEVSHDGSTHNLFVSSEGKVGINTNDPQSTLHIIDGGVAIGFDTAENDPIGTWQLSNDDFYRIGGIIGSVALPILIIQEGGYNVKTIGANAREFFTGLWEAIFI